MKRSFVRMVRGFIDRPVRLVGALIGLIAVIAALAAIPMLLPGAVPSLPRNTAPPSTEQFMRGNKEYNVDLVWSSLADEARNSIANRQAQGQGQEASQAAMQAQMQAARQRGTRIEEFNYVGGRSLPDGTSMQFYVVGYRPSGDADVEYIPYLFTLDTQGKIVKVQ